MLRPDIPDDPNLVEQATDVSGGANDNGATHLIAQNQSQILLNISPGKPGERQKSLGVLPG